MSVGCDMGWDGKEGMSLVNCQYNKKIVTEMFSIHHESGSSFKK